MKSISFKDYLFSLARGNIFEIAKLLLIHMCKVIVFNFFLLLFIFKINKKFDPDKISRIAIYFPVTSGIGDLIMANSFFKLLREKFPKKKIFIFSQNGIFINKLFYDELIDISAWKI